MKAVITVLSLCVFITPVFSQSHKDPCDKPFSIVGSMMLGGSATGPTESLEFGLWNKKNGLGISGGVMLYTGKDITNSKLSTVNTPLIKELYIRPTLKLDHNEITGFHHAVTFFAGVKGNYGGSYRAYYQCGNSIMVGLEPYISKVTGRSLNFICTFAF